MQKTIREQTPKNFIRLEKLLWHYVPYYYKGYKQKKLSVFYQVSSLQESKYHLNNT